MDLTRFTISEATNTPVYYDHKLKVDTRRTFQKLFIDDGNKLPFYKTQYNKGRIEIKDTLLHKVHIVLQDLYGNQSFLNLILQGEVPAVQNTGRTELPGHMISTDTYENTLVIKHRDKSKSPENAVVYSNRRTYEMIPSYTFPDLSVFLWDLRQGLPDSVKIGEDTLRFHYDVTIPSGTDFTYYNPYFEYKSYKSSLYDTMYLTSNYALSKDGKSEIFTIGNNETPFNGSARIRFLPRLNYDTTGQYAVYLTENFRYFEFMGNAWSGNSIGIRTSDLGKFTILRDSLPPEIDPLRISNSMASFRIRDNLSGIKDFSATINGNWLLMNFDPKKDLIWSERQNENIPLKGELYVSVTDNCGNTAEYRTKIE